MLNVPQSAFYKNKDFTLITITLNLELQNIKLVLAQIFYR
jgi:hypothetical protein